MWIQVRNPFLKTPKLWIWNSHPVQYFLAGHKCTKLKSQVRNSPFWTPIASISRFTTWQYRLDLSLLINQQQSLLPSYKYAHHMGLNDLLEWITSPSSRESPLPTHADLPTHHDSCRGEPFVHGGRCVRYTGCLNWWTVRRSFWGLLLPLWKGLHQSSAHRLYICKQASAHTDNDFQSKIFYWAISTLWETK